MPIQVTAVKQAEIKEAPALPVATVTSNLVQRNGKDGIEVIAFYPLPEDEQVLVVERKGKGDNKDQVTSRKNVYGRAKDVGLTFEQTDAKGETYGVLDGAGNQIMFSGSILNVQKFGEEEEGSEATE
jgi:hypothetical protein